MVKRTQKATDVSRAEEAIAKAAEGYPDVIEEGPWGHRAFKVARKAFLFMSTDGGELSFSVKLPSSGKAALSLGFTEPTHYGLGKAGWVTARFAPGDAIPMPTILGWLDESFRAIAPKKISSVLDSEASKSALVRKTAKNAAKVSAKAEPMPETKPARNKTKTRAETTTATKKTKTRAKKTAKKSLKSR